MSSEATHDSQTVAQKPNAIPFTFRMYLPESVPQDLVNACKKILARNHGGFTAWDADGGWVDGDGNLIEETSTVVETTVDVLPDRFNTPAEYADHWCGYVKANSSEEMVMTELRSVEVVTRE